MVYMGSKNRIANDIVPFIQNCIYENNIDTYIEPFVGGANMIDKVKCKNKIGSDLQPTLIALLNHVKDGKDLPERIGWEEYVKVRCNRDNYEPWYVGCVGFLSSRLGRYFDGGFAKEWITTNADGENKTHNKYAECRKNLLNQASKEEFKNTTFVCKDYKELLRELNPRNCLIYCDPPYSNTKGYTSCKNFSHKEFWDIIRKLSLTNYVLISEEWAPTDFEHVWEINTLRCVKVGENFDVKEVLFTYENGLYAQKYLNEPLEFE